LITLCIRTLTQTTAGRINLLVRGDKGKKCDNSENSLKHQEIIKSL